MRWFHTIRCTLLLFSFARSSFSETTVVDPDKFSWTPNAGWIDWQGNIDDGAVFDGRAASGYIYSANLGWIFLGDGTPESGISYSNTDAGDYGVNIRLYPGEFFHLNGYAWSANAGWISFNEAGPDFRPRIEKETGILKGYAYGDNIGWLTLESPGTAIVQTGLVKEAEAQYWQIYE